MGTPVRSQNWDPHPLGNSVTITTSVAGTPSPDSRSYNAQNQFDTVGGNPLDYDANGNLILDQDGNVYIYDAWNRLVRVEDSMSTLLTAYSYNALNRRIIEDDGSTETHLFYSANWQVLEEQVASDTTVQYVWSPVYIDAMILRDRDTDSDGDMDERLYVQQDANFNVTALVDPLTGDVVQRFVQDPFGLVTDVLDDSWTPQADAFDWKYLHQGLRLDVAVGMNLYDGRNRIYDPVLQRWLQVDPSGFDAGDNNLYRNVENGPVNFLDPLGYTKGWKQNWKPSFVTGKESLDDLKAMLDEALKAGKQGQAKARDLKRWIKIQKASTKYGKKFGKKIVIIGPVLTLVFFTSDAQAQGIPRAAGGAVPVLGDVLDILDDEEEHRRNEQATRAERHAETKATQMVVAWAEYELENRPCPVPKLEKIASCVQTYYRELYSAFQEEISVTKRSKWLGLGYDLVVQQVKTVDITPIALAFQKCLDDACGK